MLLYYQASVEGFCSHLKVSQDKALDLIGQSVSLAVEAKDLFMQQERSVVCINEKYFLFKLAELPHTIQKYCADYKLQTSSPPSL